MSERLILETLQKATIEAVAASIMPAIPVKYVSTGFTVPNDQKWLELVHVPNNRNDFWSDEKNHAGMFRLILHWPVNGSGAYAPIDLIESIGSYFTKDRQLGNGVKITVQPDYTGDVPDGKEILYPVSARYSCFRP